MAKVTIVGNAAVITSTIKYEDIKTVAKYRPAELILKGGDDGKEPIFAIAAVDGNGDINANGAVFGGATRDEDKYAYITMVVDADDDTDVKELVADQLGGALVNLAKLEEKLPAVIDEINDERASVLDRITVAQ